MANTPPATVTITSTTGPGQSVSAMKFTDVVDVEVDFNRNVVKLTRSGSGGVSYYDYSALGTSITWTVTNGLTTIVFS